MREIICSRYTRSNTGYKATLSSYHVGLSYRIKLNCGIKICKKYVKMCKRSQKKRYQTISKQWKRSRNDLPVVKTPWNFDVWQPFYMLVSTETSKIFKTAEIMWITQILTIFRPYRWHRRDFVSHFFSNERMHERDEWKLCKYLFVFFQ